MKLKLILLFTVAIPIYLFAQKPITGKITDKNKVAIPHSSIYLKGTSISTTSNSDGEFKLSIPATQQTLIIKAIGYKAIEKSVDNNTSFPIMVELEEESFNIESVSFTASAEDPAYAIMRNVINKRLKHLNEVKEFSTRVYIKGLQKMLDAPKNFLGVDIQKATNEIGLDSNRRGIIYLSESESIYNFKAPNQVNEEMISSKVSGSNRAFSFNRASDLKINFYENTQNLNDLSLRPIVSPLAENAMFYYRYKYLGASEENGLSILKIQVIPRRNTDPVFRGTIYIVDNQWRLIEADLTLTKEVNLNFIDELNIKQQYIPIDKDIWLPSNIKFDFTGGLLGFKFGGYFAAVFSNYDINSRKDKKAFAEIMKVTADVNKKDDGYWDNARPIPLTEEEKLDYEKKSVLAVKRESKTYLDSLDAERNKLSVSKVLWKGFSHLNRFEKTVYQFSSVKDALFYNTVEGFGLDYKASYRKQIDSVRNKVLQISTNLRYGFTSKKFHPSIYLNIPLEKINLNFSGGSSILDLNNNAYQSQLGNSLNSLLFERNHLKLYQKNFANLGLGGYIFSSVYGSMFAEYAHRKSLINLTNYTWRDYKDRSFSPNNPFSQTLDIPLFPDNSSFRIGGRLSYNFSNKYVTYPSGKFFLPSKYPTLSLGFIKGLANVLGSEVNYDFVYSELTKRDIKLGFYGKFSFMLGAGKFLNNKNIFYPDFKHFNGNQSTAYTTSNNAFLFLNIYENSTAKSYFEAHLDHNFSGFFLNKLPLIRKLKLQEVVGLNYLSTNKLGNYIETYFGVTHLTGFQISYGMSYLNGKKMENGLRLSIKL